MFDGVGSHEKHARAALGSVFAKKGFPRKNKFKTSHIRVAWGGGKGIRTSDSIAVRLALFPRPHVSLAAGRLEVAQDCRALHIGQALQPRQGCAIYLRSVLVFARRAVSLARDWFALVVGGPLQFDQRSYLESQVRCQ